jgi:hypothetical protein
MATTPAAGNLDEDTLTRISHEAVQASMEKRAQVFDKYGYMTGQEWYDKFIKEADHTPVEWPENSSREYITAMVGIAYINAAKKASGIQD